MWEFLPKSRENSNLELELRDDTEPESPSYNALEESDIEKSGERPEGARMNIVNNSNPIVGGESNATPDTQIDFNNIGMNSFEEYLSTGYYLYPRSSIAKTQLMMANHVGVIDSGYRNNLLSAFRYLPEAGESKTPYKIAAGTRLVQICHPCLSPIYVSILNDEKYLTKTARTGGFGSTGGTV